MKEKIIIALILTLIKNVIKLCLDAETQRRFIDACLDLVENFVTNTANGIDDEIILPICKSIRLKTLTCRTMIEWKNIIIHHSATNDDESLSWGAIRRCHTDDRGWNDIGYHFGLEWVRDTYEILIGRMLDREGAHTVGRNSDSIGICCVGNFNVLPPPTGLTAKLVWLCRYLCKRYDIEPVHIYPHNKFANKDCPGKLFDIDELILSVTRCIIANP